ncbi:MAG: cob(I)yrinic acid a,c-diamide adenosyltransferase [Candidatus Woesearchaeota archaeon]
MIYTFYGENKGKTSAALGTVMRALGAGKRTRIVFFMKHWRTSESKFLEDASKTYDVKYFLAGDDDFIYSATVREEEKGAVRAVLKFGDIKDKDEKDKELAKAGMNRAKEYMGENPFLLVLDEINTALTFGLVTEDDLILLLDVAKKKGTHIVLTGRGLTEKIKEKSDLITEMKKIKHPFDAGQHAIPGLDY